MRQQKQKSSFLQKLSHNNWLQHGFNSKLGAQNVQFLVPWNRSFLLELEKHTNTKHLHLGLFWKQNLWVQEIICRDLLTWWRGTVLPKLLLLIMDVWGQPAYTTQRHVSRYWTYNQSSCQLRRRLTSTFMAMNSPFAMLSWQQKTSGRANTGIMLCHTPTDVVICLRLCKKKASTSGTSNVTLMKTMLGGLRRSVQAITGWQCSKGVWGRLVWF